VAIVKMIDIVFITKNSVEPCLGETLFSIVSEIPFNQFIVVDSYSTDGTIGLIEEIIESSKLKIIQGDYKRGKAREIGVKLVETEWFAFVDSDVILADNWFSKIKEHIKPEIGAIEGNVIVLHPHERFQGVQKRPQKIRPKGRAYTNCTLIRTDSVKNIEIPMEMNVLEDHFIRKYIEKRNYSWLKVGDPCSIHNSDSDMESDAYEVGRMSGKYYLISFTDHFKALVIDIIKKILGRPVNMKISWNKVKGQIDGIRQRQ
jgi:glycosyltransferase involved in cell wall biosynthesis